MAAIAHGITNTTTNLSNTGSTSWVQAQLAASTNFVGGGKYLLIAGIGALNGTSVGASVGARLVHGTTPFAQSEMRMEPLNSASVVNGLQYLFTTVFTQPGTPEDIALEIATHDAAQTVNAVSRLVAWIRLDADLTENTDWVFGESSTDGAMAVGTWTSRAQVTVPEAGNWLLLGLEQVDHADQGSFARTRLVRDPAGTPVQRGGVFIQEAKDSTDIHVRNHWWVETTTGSATFAVQDQTDSGAHTHFHSSLFAINLNRLNQAVWAASATEETATSANNLNPDSWADPNVAVAGDWLILGSVVVNPDLANSGARFQVEVDGTDVDQYGQTSGRQVHSTDAEAEPMGYGFGLTALTTGVRDVDFDASTGSASGTYKDQFVVAFSMELAAAPRFTLVPAGTGTGTNVVDQADATTNLHQAIDDTPWVPTDADWINNSDTSGSVFLDLTDTPSDFGTMDSLTVTVRYKGSNISGTLTLFAQLFQSDETTSLSDEVQVAQVTTSGNFANTSAITFTGLNTTAGKAAWDGARLRLRWATT